MDTLVIGPNAAMVDHAKRLGLVPRDAVYAHTIHHLRGRHKPRVYLVLRGVRPRDVSPWGSPELDRQLAGFNRHLEAQLANVTQVVLP